MVCQNQLPHYLRKKYKKNSFKITIIILDIVAHFIPGLGNQKQHNYRTSTYHAILIQNYLLKLIYTNVALGCFK